MINELEDIKKKILFLYQRKIKAHVKLKHNVVQKDGTIKSQFNNGLITKVSDAWFLIEDEVVKSKYGKYPNIWFMDVKEVEPFLFRGEEQ